jgi:hypothetical protein
MSLITINWKPEPKQLQTFGIAAMVIFFGFGAWIWWSHGIFGVAISASIHSIAVTSMLIVAGIFGFAALLAPFALKPVFVFLSVITAPIGIALSFFIMTIIFFGMFTPIGLFFKLIGRDAMNRKIELTRCSYWTEREPSPPTERYFRQY